MIDLRVCEKLNTQCRTRSGTPDGISLFVFRIGFPATNLVFGIRALLRSRLAVPGSSDKGLLRGNQCQSEVIRANVLGARWLL
jgi:hypothetical protein